MCVCVCGLSPLSLCVCVCVCGSGSGGGGGGSSSQHFFVNIALGTHLLFKCTTAYLAHGANATSDGDMILFGSMSIL